MKTLTVKLRDAEETLGRIHETDGGADTLCEFWDDEVSVMTLFTPAVHIPSLDLYLFEGVYYVDGMSDFSLTAVYKGEPDPNREPDYWEQDPMDVALYNFLASDGKEHTLKELEELDCEITTG